MIKSRVMFKQSTATMCRVCLHMFLCVCAHRCLSYLWRFEGVVCGEVYGQEENPALVRTVILINEETHLCHQ